MSEEEKNELRRKNNESQKRRREKKRIAMSENLISDSMTENPLPLKEEPSGTDQGNLLKGIVIWVVAARCVVQSPKRSF